MFGILQSKKPFVYTHWLVPLFDFRSDSAACYRALEEDLAAREMPELVVERIDFPEGGILSPRRVFLRLRREMAVLDFCSAPFGKAWYFSCRAAALPRVLYWWEVYLALLGMAGFFAIYWMLFGLVTAAFVWGASAVFVLGLFLSARQWAGLDEFLIHLPVAGVFYEVYLRRDTYHRQDQRRVYASMVNTIIQAKVREFCLAGGVEDPDFQQVDTPDQILTPRQLAKYFPHLSPGLEAEP